MINRFLRNSRSLIDLYVSLHYIMYIMINMYIKQICRPPVVENRIQGGDQEGQHCKATAHRRCRKFLVSSAIMRKPFHCCDWLSKFLKQVF